MDEEDRDVEIVVKINRTIVEERELATIVFEGLVDTDGENIAVNLADSDVADIKALFDSLFSKIYESKATINFLLDDSKSDLYNQVTTDIIGHLEKEIEQSQDNFQKIWELTNDEGSEE